MNVLIVNAYGHSNRGDSVLLDECVAEVREVLPNAQIAIALFEGGTGHGLALERIGNHGRLKGKLARLETIFYLIAARLPKPFWRLLPPMQAQTLDFMKKADLVISAPGGYINDVNAAWIVALAHIERAQSFGKPVLMSPQSIGPMRSAFGRSVLGHVLSRCEINCAREVATVDLLRASGVPNDRIQKTGDSAFWNYPESVARCEVDAAFRALGVEPDTQFIGATAVDWPFPHSSNAAQLRDDYANAMVRIVLEIYNRHGLKTLFFNQVDDDRAMLTRIGAQAGEAAVIQGQSPQSAVLRAMMARSQSFIGTRFHSCIFAMMGGVPTTAIAYLPKTTGIMYDLQIDRVVPIEHVDVEKILQNVASDLADPDEARAKLAANLADYRAREVRFSHVLENFCSRTT